MKNRRFIKLLAIALALLILMPSISVIIHSANIDKTNDDLYDIGDCGIICEDETQEDVSELQNDSPLELTIRENSSDAGSYSLKKTDTSSFYTSYDEAAAYLRSQLVAREKVIEVSVRVDAIDNFYFGETLAEMALDHTGVPNEGDYIKRNSRSYRISSEEITSKDGYYYMVYTYNCTYLTTAEQEAEVDAAVEKLLLELDLWSSDDYTKVKTVYDYITENVDYDLDEVEKESSDNYLHHSTYSAIVKKLTVCQGYSTLFYRLMLELGVDARYVNGTALGGSHAWNIVCLDGEYYFVDATWDEGMSSYYRYFLCTEEGMGQHTLDYEYKTEEFQSRHPFAKTPYVVNKQASGTLNSKIKWVLDGDTGVLTVTGTGDMPNFTNITIPWWDYTENVAGIVVSEGITKIGDYAFKRCKYAATISLPSTLKSIGKYSFDNCRSITEIDLPEGLTSIDSSAFAECTSLRSVVIPGSVKSFGTSIFSTCHNLSSVTFAEGMTVIPSSMFFNSDGLTAVTFPSTLIEIESTAFRDCDGLAEINLPAHVTKLGYAAFSDCNALKNIYVDSENPSYCDVSGVLFTKDKATLVNFPAGRSGTYTVPQGTRIIGEASFCDAQKMTSIVIPDSVTEIGRYAFTWCYGLTNIIVGENIEKVCEYAYGFCKSLKSIEFKNPDTVIESYCFSNCTDLTKVILPKNLKILEFGTFSSCSALKEIEIPKTLKSMESSVFTCCDALESIVFPATLTALDRRIFDRCYGLREATILGNLKKIDYECFDSCTSLRFLRFGGTISSVDSTAFVNTDNITAVYFDNSSAARGVTSVSSYANMCANAKSIAMPRTVTPASYVKSKYTNVSDIMFMGVEYKLYSDHICTWVRDTGSNDIERYYCSTCRAKKDMNTLEHGFVITRVEATCTEDGYERGYCYHCGESYEEIFPAIGHNYESYTIDATCMNEEYVEYFCRNCYESYYEVIGPMKDHKFSYWCWAMDPTCYEPGLEYRECTFCGFMEFREIEPSHMYFEEVYYPDCWNDGYTYYYCWLCGDSYVSNYIPSPGHDYEAVSITDPTCIEDGYTYYYCSVCGEDCFGDIIPALGHNYGDWYTTLEPTCLEKGTEQRNCSRCDHFETQIIDALGHDIKLHPSRAPTCTEIGWEEYETCTRCVLDTTIIIILATGHNFNAVVTEPTCTTQGYTTYTCSSCGDSYKTDYVEEYGHLFGDWYETKAPACVDYGSKRRDCERCDRYETQEIPPLGHALETKGPKSPTCTEIGWSEYKICARCDYTTYSELSPLGHDLTAHKSKAPACTEIGWNEYETCSRCDYTTYEEIAVTGHSYNEAVTYPTCTEQGYTTYTCHCGDSYIGGYVDALGHDLTVHPSKAPTCTENGWSEYVLCSRCDYTTISLIAPKGHEYEAFVVTPTCKSNGYTIYACFCGNSYFDEYVDPIAHSYSNGICTMCSEKDPSSTEHILGDLDGDGKINAKDANILIRIVAGTIVPSKVQRKAADVNNDGRVNSIDANLIVRIAAGLTAT